MLSSSFFVVKVIQRISEFILHYSYKEHSDGTTDEDDVIETSNSGMPEIPDDAETIEKVLTHRFGKPGG